MILKELLILKQNAAFMNISCEYISLLRSKLIELVMMFFSDVDNNLNVLTGII